MNLKAEQKRLYGLLPAHTRCFLRVCDDDSALWVSDLPRRYAACENLIIPLADAGFAVTYDEAAEMWYIDWTQEQWQKMLGDLPFKLPPFSEKEIYHEAYALCRIWLLHPASLSDHLLPIIRRVLKLTVQPQQKLLCAVRTLHEQAAAQLRSGYPVAYDAGRILAAWLNEHARGKENEL